MIYLAIILITGLIFIFLEIILAKNGYEDQNGFHIKESKENKLGRLNEINVTFNRNV